MIEKDTLFMTKRAKKHALWDCTNPYGPYKEVPPPPLPGLVVLLMISDCHGGCHGDAVTYELLVRLVFNQVLRSQKQIKVIILTNHKAHSQSSEPI